MADSRNRAERLEHLLRKGMVVARRRFAPGIRSLVGLLLVVGGFYGFLPILGFWMIPLGLAFIAIDIPPMRRRFMNWLRKRRHARKKAGPDE